MPRLMSMAFTEQAVRDRVKPRPDPSAWADHMVVDLTDVPFLGSAGLSVLIDHRERCRQRDVTFSVVAAHRAVVHTMRITALDRVIPLRGTVAEAIESAIG